MPGLDGHVPNDPASRHDRAVRREGPLRFNYIMMQFHSYLSAIPFIFVSTDIAIHDTWPSNSAENFSFYLLPSKNTLSRQSLSLQDSNYQTGIGLICWCKCTQLLKWCTTSQQKGHIAKSSGTGQMINHISKKSITIMLVRCTHQECSWAVSDPFRPTFPSDHEWAFFVEENRARDSWACCQHENAYKYTAYNSLNQYR
jgi:hypothetical protein